MRGEGFTVRGRVEYEEVNLEDLADFAADTEVTPELMVENGLVKKLGLPIKILGRGDVSVALKVKANKISKSAKEKIDSAGGSVELIQD
jgi:large subunit ribosomal protein L15